MIRAYLDQNYILLLQISSLSARLFYLGLEPKREKQEKTVLEIWYIKDSHSQLGAPKQQQTDVY